MKPQQPLKKSRKDDNILNAESSSSLPHVDSLFRIDPNGDETGSIPVIPEVDVVLSSTVPTQSELPCKYFALGTCSAGSGCKFSHASRSPAVCQYFLKGNCRLGLNCRFSHKEQQCKFFQSLRGCKNASCPFAHVKESITVLTPAAPSKILDKYSSIKLAESRGVSDMQTRSMCDQELVDILKDDKMADVFWSKIRHKNIDVLSVFFPSETCFKNSIFQMLKMQSPVHVASLVTLASSEPEELLANLIQPESGGCKVHYNNQSVFLDEKLDFSNITLLVAKGLAAMIHPSSIRNRRFPIVSEKFDVTILKNDAKKISLLMNHKLHLFAFPRRNTPFIYQAAYPFDIEEGRVRVRNPYQENMTYSFTLCEFEATFPTIHALYRR